MSSSPFSELGLVEPIVRVLRREAYAAPTPIQTEAIPALLQGRDLLGIAQTGTGKTAAFALPIIQRLLDSADTVHSFAPRALIMTPTRELAAQIGERIGSYASHTELRCGVVVGGTDIDAQSATLRSGIHILVATPGRLLDLMRKKHVRLGKIEAFVLDEADRMLDMGFLKDVRVVIRGLPPVRQANLFSATMPTEIVEIANRLLTDPVRVEVTASATTSKLVVQQVYHVERGDKRALLADILLDPAIRRALVFTATKRTANETARYLRELGVGAEAIHGNKSQAMREATLKSFRQGRFRVLVASDLAARGLDVVDITHVFNFDLPDVPETYVHRIGRTARAGRRGVAISFCDSRERIRLRNIETCIRQVIEVIEDHPFRSKVPVELGQFRPRQKLSPKPNKKTSGRGSRPTKSRRQSPRETDDHNKRR
ncbi:MAG: DEAD/DEAH box helicase [Planctomycetota bacterium]|nr:DEAD/DEAH box helicase [Planctomycetota bacterium]